MRIQFDLSEDERVRFLKYEDEKYRQKFARDAFTEKLNRLESKDKEKITADKAKLSKTLKPIIKEILKEEGVI